jgi:hypothetical protein
VEITLTVADTLEVRRWILGYGEQAEIVAPAEMRDALRVDAEAQANRVVAARKPLLASAAARRGPTPREIRPMTRGVR